MAVIKTKSGYKDTKSGKTYGSQSDAIKSAKSSGGSSSLSQLESVTAQAKSLGIDTGKAEQMIAQTKAEGSKPFATSSYNKPITSSSLTQTGPLSLPGVPSYPETEALGGFISSANDSFTQNLAQERKNHEASASSSRDTYTDFIKNLRSQIELEDEAYRQKGGVDSIQKDLDDINQQIRAEELSIRRAEEAIDERGGGLEMGAQAEKQNIRREGYKAMADLYIVQQGIQGKYDSAKAIADRAVSAYMEQQKVELEALKFVYEENKELFTKAEQREFETMLADRNRAIENEAEDAKALQTAKIEAIRMARMNGAPSSVVTAIQSAQSPEEVFDVGGQYASGDMLDRAYKAEQLKALRTKPEALAPTDVIDQGGRKLLINTQTGEVIKDFGVSDTPVDELKTAVTQQQVSQVDDLKAHKGFNSAVGPIGLGRIPIMDIAGAKDAFIGSVEQLTSGLTLEQLINAKDSGATFGALSDAELRLIEQSATRIKKWAIEEDGKVTGYDVSEKDFMEELDNIANFRKLDAVLKGVEPGSVGVVQTPDGHYWAQNGDGSMTKIR